jgi:hypothetical protein
MKSREVEASLGEFEPAAFHRVHSDLHALWNEGAPTRPQRSFLGPSIADAAALFHAAPDSLDRLFQHLVAHPTDPRLLPASIKDLPGTIRETFESYGRDLLQECLVTLTQRGIGRGSGVFEAAWLGGERRPPYKVRFSNLRQLTLNSKSGVACAGWIVQIQLKPRVDAEAPTWVQEVGFLHKNGLPRFFGAGPVEQIK